MTQNQSFGPVRLGSLLPPAKILFFKNMGHKKEVLRQLVCAACPEIALREAQNLAGQIEKREETISTALHTGIALPHIRVEGLKQLCAALALFPKPVLFSGEKEVQVLLLFLSPDDPAFFNQHLQLLSISARTFTPDFVRQLAACPNAEKAASLLNKTNMVQ